MSGNAYLAWITGVMMQQIKDKTVGMERGSSFLFLLANAHKVAMGTQRQYKTKLKIISSPGIELISE